MKVLLAEDDLAIRDAVFRSLRNEKFEVIYAPDGETALAEILTHTCDLVIIDIGLPKLSGIDVIRSVRATGSDIPIIVITGEHSKDICINGLDSGADDYIVKPFFLDELKARIRALLRRRQLAWGARIVVGKLEYDRVNRTFYTDSRPFSLSRREMDILEALVERAEDLVRKSFLVKRLSRWDQEVTPNLIEVYIHKLRRELAPLSLEIQTIRGLGYVLSPIDSSKVTGDAKKTGQSPVDNVRTDETNS